MQKQFANRYQIISTLGEGGMGLVLHAHDPLLQKEVAIKVTHKCVTGEQTVRFQTEAKATARLNHHNIVRILDFGVTFESEPYMVMEFVDGQSLASLLKAQEPLSIETCLQLFFQLGTALQHAHQRNILHRDLKPSNVMVTENEDALSIKLVDFGIAKFFDQEPTRATESQMLGSPPYMSPEQATSEPVDTRSDIYSMGCLMYECLAGHPPFEGENALTTLSMHVTEQAPALASDVPDWLNDIVFKCLEKNPNDRHQSATDLLNALRLGYKESDIESVAIDQVVASFRPQNQGLQLGVVSLVVLLIMTGVVAVIQSKRTPVLDSVNIAPKVVLTPKEEDQLDEYLTPAATQNGTDLKLQSYKDDDLAKLTAYKNVESLDLLQCPEITGSGFKHILRFKLRALRVKSPITDASMKYIGQMKDLDFLKLDTISTLTGAGFAELKTLKNLKGLSLERCKVTNDAFKEIAQIASLEGVSMKRAYGFDEIGLSYMAARKIRHLDLSYTDLTDKILSGLKGASIEDFHVPYNEEITSASYDTLASIKNANVVDIRETSIKDIDKYRLAKVLKLKLINGRLQH